MKKTILHLSIALVSSGIASVALADDSTNNMPNSNMPDHAKNGSMVDRMSDRMLQSLTTQQFVTDAATGGMKEIRASELALQNSQNEEVRSFAHKMIMDHTQAGNKLAALAQQKGLDLPATNSFAADDANWNNPMITGSEQIKDAYLLKTNLALSAYSDVKQLKTLQGRDFDQAYAKTMVMDHVNTVIEFEAASRMLPDQDIKQFAQDTLPTLRMHKEMAKKLAAQLNGTTTAQVQSPTATTSN